MNRNILSIVLAGLEVVFSICSAARAAGGEPVVYYVGPDGRDSWSGRLARLEAAGSDGPFATVEAACRAARRAAGRPRRIVLASGRYFLERTLLLGQADAGLVLEAGPGERVELIGGRRVRGWKRDGPNFYSADLPQVKQGKWDFRVLVVNGRYCGRARLPEKGTFEHLSSFNVPWMTTTGGGWKRKPTQQELTTLRYKSEDLGDWLDIRNAEVTVYHMWDESLLGLAGNDTGSNVLRFSSPASHPPGAFGIKKYVVWNVREGMTRPGQWYLDRTAGKVVYWPLPGEDMNEAEVFAPVLESIIRIERARDITIRGLTLTVTTTPLKAGGFGAGAFAGALTASSAQDCRFVNLEILNVAGQGIKASGKRLTVERCHVHHTGACGVVCSGEAVVVADNHIHDVGLTYPSALALRGGGTDSRYVHNEIHDAPYTAINCGGQNNLIEGNLIYRAMTELHDGGGIYCFAGKNLVLRGNFIRDIVDTGGYGASAYYLDERSQGCVVEGNLSVGIVRPSHNHMATGNAIRDNVFISSGDARLTWPRSSGYTFERNVIVAAGKVVFDNPDAITTWKNNCIYSSAGQVVGKRLERYSSKGSSLLEARGGSVFADPKLIEYDKGLVRFAPGSPVVGLGIKPIDVSGAGPRE